MSQTAVAQRYAKALVELAQEQKTLDQVYADVVLVQDMLEASRELRLTVKSPVVSGEAKKRVFFALLSKKSTELMQRFISLLIDKRREEVLPLVLRSFAAIYEELNGIQKAVVKSAAPLNKGQVKEVEDLVKKLSGRKTVQLTTLEDKDLLGGFVLNLGFRQVDTSLKTKLKEIKTKLVNQ